MHLGTRGNMCLLCAFAQVLFAGILTTGSQGFSVLVEINFWNHLDFR